MVINTSLCSWEPNDFSMNQLFHPLIDSYSHSQMCCICNWSPKVMTLNNSSDKQSLGSASYLGQRGGRNESRAVKDNIFLQDFKGFLTEFMLIFLKFIGRKEKSHFSSVSEELKTTYFLFDSLQAYLCIPQEWTKVCFFPHLVEIFLN